MNKPTTEGLFAIGLFNPKNEHNFGSVLRAGGCYGSSMIAVQGSRFKKSKVDVQKTWKDQPIIATPDLIDTIPYGMVPVAVEFIPSAISLVDYVHPLRAFYIFGPEDGSISSKILSRCKDVIYVPTNSCMNLAATVNVVLYDRLAKQLRK
jgi:tRNA(Leu) C34 or U34 (ribose-2'-O)-methylase TrmL